MRVRNLLWISMINIFLLCLVSVVMEYSDLNGRFKKLQNTVSTAMETAIRTSTASEELFSEKYKYSSTSSKGNGSIKDSTESTLRVLSRYGQSWVEGNTYAMAYFYSTHNRFPVIQAEYDGFINGFGTDEDIYEWLFGNVGSVWNTHDYSWANSRSKMWNSINWLGIDTDRTPTDNFRLFYDRIGQYLKTETYVKVKSTSTFNKYIISKASLPALTLMGLNLGDENSRLSHTNDYLSSVVHFGKSSNGVATTTYYLTPYSLGVTYVPVEVLKPVFLSHMEQLIEYNKVKSTISSDLEDLWDASGCISTEVFDGGTTSAYHADSSKGTRILNDGEIEYDLSSAKVKVDYFLVDFYDNKNYLVVNRIEGATSQYNSSGRLDTSDNSSLQSLPYRLKLTDTSGPKNGNRIVAKVSVKLKIHIPYKSSILQWFRHLTDKDGTNHYDIKLWDESSGTVDFDSDGVWFYYTTYTAITR